MNKKLLSSYEYIMFKLHVKKGKKPFELRFNDLNGNTFADNIIIHIV